MSGKQYDRKNLLLETCSFIHDKTALASEVIDSNINIYKYSIWSSGLCICEFVFDISLLNICVYRFDRTTFAIIQNRGWGW